MENHSLLEGILVTGAGFFPDAEGHFILRPHGATTHLLIVCLKGEGVVSIGRKQYQATSGDTFWLPANISHRYKASQRNPWTILWAHFTGNDAEAWRELIFDRGESDTCHISSDQVGNLSLNRIHSILENGYSLLNLVDASTALRFSLGMLERLKQQSAATTSARLRVAESVDKLREDWNHLHRIEELAAQAGVSVSHYAALFKKETGFSPIDFLIRQRIQKAAHLLATTQEPIASVSASAGYEEPYYFSRSFKKIMGCSPREYRKTSSV